jgi:Rubrerythrin
MMEFNDSQTRTNLMRAFAKESQARNRYTFAAEEAKKQKLQVIEYIFQFTANQEKEHAVIFYNHLKQLAGEHITIDDKYPVDIYTDVLRLLRSAEQREYEETDTAYKSYGDMANGEGFAPIADSFYKIAEIEKTHGDRFKLFADLLEQNKLFISDVDVKWMCLNCGYVFSGKEAPASCPVCSHDQGFFIRLELAPFTK